SRGSLECYEIHHIVQCVCPDGVKAFHDQGFCCSTMHGPVFFRCEHLNLERMLLSSETIITKMFWRLLASVDQAKSRINLHFVSYFVRQRTRNLLREG